MNAPFRIPPGRLAPSRGARTREIAFGSRPLALACALLGLAACGESEAPAPPLWNDPARPNLVLVTLDTTRPDHLGCYGYGRDTSPRLDAVCEHALVFENAYSTTSWTLPAHASLFTGLLPASHGADYDDEGGLLLSDVLDERSADGHRVKGLSPAVPTLAGLLAERGYATAGFVGGPWLNRVFGLSTGFAHWDDRDLDALNGRRAEGLSDAALAWLEAQGDREPFFLFLNYYDPHSPYEPPEGWRDVFWPQGAPPPGSPQDLALATALYDAEIRYADHHLGRVFDRLRERGAWDASWVVVTADHGDLLGEHGMAGHGRFLFEGEIRIPLIVKPPLEGEGNRGDRAGREKAPIQLNDVMALLADSLGYELPVDAKRTRELLGERGRSRVVSELDPGPRHRGRGRWKAIAVGREKFVWNSRGKHRFFDLETAGAEGINRIGDRPERADFLARELSALLDALPTPEAVEPGSATPIDAETRRALEELGYLDRDEP